MKQIVFAVYDSKLAAFFPPFFCQHAAIAKRSFMAIANDKVSQVYAHPQDFTLFEIADWDDETGEFKPKQHVNHGLAAIYKVRELDHAKASQESLSDETHVQRGSQG